MNATAPLVGVFDSGIGGLSVLRALRGRLPQARFAYLADNAQAPYGERDPDWLRAHVLALIGAWHAQTPLDLLVVACNTATAVAIDALRQAHPALPVVGIEPALRPALASTHSGHVGALATRATLQSDRYRQLRARCLADHPQARLHEQAGDGLADAIERGDEPQVQALARHHIGELMRQGPAIDTLVLGCTHYPLAAPLLQAAAGDAVTLIDPADAVARRAHDRLPGPGSAGEGGEVQWLCTGSPAALQRAAARWLGLDATVAQAGFAPAA